MPESLSIGESCSLATEQVFRETDNDIDGVAPVPGNCPQ